MPIKLEIKPILTSPLPLPLFLPVLNFTSTYLPPSCSKSRVRVGQELGLWSIQHRFSLPLLPPQGKDCSHCNPVTSPSLTLVSAELFLSHAHSSLSGCRCSRAELLPFKCVTSEVLSQGLKGSALDRSRFSWSCLPVLYWTEIRFWHLLPNVTHVASSLQKPCHTNQSSILLSLPNKYERRNSSS